MLRVGSNIGALVVVIIKGGSRKKDEKGGCLVISPDAISVFNTTSILFSRYFSNFSFHSHFTVTLLIRLDLILSSGLVIVTTKPIIFRFYLVFRFVITRVNRIIVWLRLEKHTTLRLGSVLLPLV